MLPTLLLLACSRQIVLTYETRPCEDWVLGDPPELRVAQEDADVAVSRVGVDANCAAVFRPTLLANNWQIQVFEDWDEPDDGGDCTTCAAPTVLLVSPPPGSFELQWFASTDTIYPSDTVSFEAP